MNDNNATDNTVTDQPASVGSHSHSHTADTDTSFEKLKKIMMGLGGTSSEVEREEIEREPDENLTLKVVHYRSWPGLNPSHDAIEYVAYKLWQVGFSADPVANWVEARSRLVSGLHGLPTDGEVAVSAYFVWQSGFSDEPTANWEEGRAQLLATRVWENPYLRMMIIAHTDMKTKLHGIARISPRYVVPLVCF